jgi:hypothetical protein|nr:MAG TPA: hypothetical protein [Caudoviricetes sp.]
MAKNWTMCEAIEEMANGTKESIADFGGRYPLTTTLMAKAVSGDKEAVVELIKALPEHITVRKIEATLKTGVAEVEANEETEEVEEKKPVKKEKKAAKEEAEDYKAMTAMELFKECKKRGIKAEAKKSEKYYIGLLKKDDAKNTETEEDGWGEEEDKKPAKKEKKTTKKEAEPEEADDDDDEWEI